MQTSLLTASCALIATARWLFLATLFAIPWLFGGTRGWTIRAMEVALFSLGALWLAGVAIRGWPQASRPAAGVPKGLLLFCGAAALLGWSITLNVQSYFESYLMRMVRVPEAIDWWPGTVEGTASHAGMVRVSALLAALVFSTELATQPRWRRRLFATIAGAGITIALFGLAQKIFGGPLFFWESGRFDANSFAMYRYHANAAAFLNLAWPIGVALSIEAFQSNRAHLSRAVWLPGTVVMLAGVAVNVSKGGHLVAILLMLLGGAMSLAARSRPGHPVGMKPWRWVLLGLIGMSALVWLVMLIGPEGSTARWTHVFTRIDSQAGRVLMPQACLDIIRERPWFGFGPATFETVFPFYSHPYGTSLTGIWRYAHCDYLQTLVEWGVIGGLLWGGIFFGGIGKAAWLLVKRSPLASDGPSWPRLYDAALLVSLGGVAIHASFDFPLQIASIQLHVAALLGCAWRVRARKVE